VVIEKTAKEIPIIFPITHSRKDPLSARALVIPENNITNNVENKSFNKKPIIYFLAL